MAAVGERWEEGGVALEINVRERDQEGFLNDNESVVGGSQCQSWSRRHHRHHGLRVGKHPAPGGGWRSQERNVDRTDSA